MTRLRAQPQTNGILHEDKIIKTCFDLKMRGLKDTTVTTVWKKLDQIAKHADIMNPKEVVMFLTMHTASDATKQKLANCYEYFCQTHGRTCKENRTTYLVINDITAQKPHYKCEESVPIIPTADNVNKIISASSRRYATIFTIMAEIGAEGQELHNVHRSKIDTEQGVISIQGTKGHASGTYKLKQHTAEMLREYIAKNPQDQPFPNPKRISEIWRKMRDRLADNLKQPELHNIPLKNLRNYSGAQLYLKFPDPIGVMRHLRHKKLETTMHYLRAIVLNGEEEYICKTATTPQEITKLIEEGFTKTDEIDGIHFYRKRK